MANEAAAKRNVYVCVSVCVRVWKGVTVLHNNNKNENNENQCKAV